MLKNYWKMAVRNFLKDRQFTILNLIGLSTGLASTLLILLWVNDEWHFDKFHANDARLYQVMASNKTSSGISTAPVTPAPLAAALATELPEVQYAAASQGSFSGKYTVATDEKSLKATGLYATRDFFRVFSFGWLAGDLTRALEGKTSIVISKDLALRLFGTTDNVVGRSIKWEQSRIFEVSGLFAGTPANSSLQFDFVLPMEVFLDDHADDRKWENSDPSTYVVLKEGADVNLFDTKIAGFLKTKLTGTGTTLFIRRFSSGYLYDKYENGVAVGGRIEYVRLFSIVALFILVIACINFMNLSTARASRRMKEVGIQKVVGATRRTLVFQYLGESMLMSMVSLAGALALVGLLLPAFNRITGKELVLRFDTIEVTAIVGIAFLTGLLAGSYPALYLSRFKPEAVLKGKLRDAAGELWVRRGLVVFQFTISVVFIVSSVVVYRQIEFIQANNKGFNKDNVVSFNAEGNFDNLNAFVSNMQGFIAEVRGVPGVLRVSSMDHGSIVGDFGTTGDIVWPGKGPKDNINFGNIGVNYGLIETLGMQIVGGRTFDPKLSSDSSEIIFNETAIRAMHLKDPIGKVVHMWDKDRRIVGIVKDFHFESVHEPVRPFAFRLEPQLTFRVVAKIQAGQEAGTLAAIRALFARRYPGFPFDYAFLDQQYQAQYVAEERIAELSRYFTCLAILISCLGLFGLAAFTAERRIKEIGIRKVLGASTSGVAVLLSADLLRLVALSILIAFPVAWWLASQWLNGFAYRIDLDIMTFLVAGAATILITLCTISFQTIRAAVADPVKNLRSE